MVAGIDTEGEFDYRALVGYHGLLSACVGDELMGASGWAFKRAEVLRR